MFVCRKAILTVFYCCSACSIIPSLQLAAVVAVVPLILGTQTATEVNGLHLAFGRHTPLALEPAAFSKCPTFCFSSSSDICLALHFSPPSNVDRISRAAFFAIQRVSKASQAQMGRNYRNLYYPGIDFHLRVTLCSPRRARWSLQSHNVNLSERNRFHVVSQAPFFGWR